LLGRCNVFLSLRGKGQRNISSNKLFLGVTIPKFLNLF
jgi:hypothetical protein